MLPLAFYTVADERFFVGAVALLNSLRLTGHDEPLFVVDAGLTHSQREVLDGHVTILPGPPGAPAVFLTPYGAATRPAEVAVVLDADIVVTRNLGELVELAHSGRMVTFVNNAPNHDRFFSGWSRSLGLGTLEQRPYFNAGQLVIPRRLAAAVLDQWVEGLASVTVAQTWAGKSTLADPFYFGDQDVLNALAMSRMDDEDVVRLEHRLAPHPPFFDLQLRDAHTLDCRYSDGERPYFLHHTMAKPWLVPTRATVYSALLPRLLLSPDVPVRLTPHQLPVRLRQGRVAAAAMRGADAQAAAYTFARSQLGRFGMRTRLRAWRGRRGTERHARG